MNNKIRHTFIFLFVFSVFSLTLQTSIIQVCKDSKVFKTQYQQIPIAEEEEEKSHGSDGMFDKDVVYLSSDDHSNFKKELNLFFFRHLHLTYCSIPLDILIPPPKA